MLKKLIPFVLLVFVSACANTQTATTADAGTKMHNCEKCECCKSGKCACSKHGGGKMCKKGEGQSMKAGEECPICAKAEREWKEKNGGK